MANQKAAKDITAAVHAARLYIGSDATTLLRDQQKLYNSMMKKIAAVAQRRNMDEYSAYEQIIDAAKSLGGIRPIPGRDI